jgi:Mg/Co/Ni transporter MgtE
MTALSCMAIGIAFLIALFLLVVAGALLGGVIPWLLERSRRPPKPPESGPR